jgi:outer membrane murein-binding lipoprotein Lpp
VRGPLTPAPPQTPARLNGYAETVDTLKAKNAALHQRVAALAQQCAASEAQVQRLDSELEQRVTEQTAGLTTSQQLLQSVIDSYPAIMYRKRFTNCVVRTYGEGSCRRRP